MQLIYSLKIMDHSEQCMLYIDDISVYKIQLQTKPSAQIKLKSKQKKVITIPQESSQQQQHSLLT